MTYKGNERGAISGLLVALILVSLLLVGALSFGVWAFMGRQDYRDNVDAKIATAVEANTKTVRAEDAAQYAEEEKNPLRTYSGPSEYGSVQIKYPKTWSVYEVAGNSSTPLALYANPAVVPSVTDKDSRFALRVEVTSASYSATVARYASQQRSGGLSARPFALANNPEQQGLRLEGQLTTQVEGVMVILPLRDKALKIWTESSSYYKDFDNIILPNASFSP